MRSCFLRIPLLAANGVEWIYLCGFLRRKEQAASPAMLMIAAAAQNVQESVGL